MNTLAPRSVRCWLIQSGLFAGVAPGQVVRPPAPTEARPKAALPATSEVNTPREEPVQLNAFEVASNRDYGYLATNSSTATGSRTAVRDTPMSITPSR